MTASNQARSAAQFSAALSRRTLLRLLSGVGAAALAPRALRAADVPPSPIRF